MDNLSQFGFALGAIYEQFRIGELTLVLNLGVIGANCKLFGSKVKRPAQSPKDKA